MRIPSPSILIRMVARLDVIIERILVSERCRSIVITIALTMVLSITTYFNR